MTGPPFPPPVISAWLQRDAVDLEDLRAEMQAWMDHFDADHPDRCPSACSEMHTYEPGCAMWKPPRKEDDAPRPWDGHACSAMLPKPHGRYCPWCGTQPARDVSWLGTEEAVFGDDLED